MKSRNWRRSIQDRVNSKWGLILILVGPIHALLFSLLLFPFLLEIFVALSSWTPYGGEWWQAEFNYGINFQKLIVDLRFLLSIGRTALITGIAVGAEFIFGLILALTFTRRFKGKKVLVSLFLVPMFIMPIIVGYDFWMLLQPSGPINHAISVITGTEFSVKWLARPNLAVFSIIITDIWHWTPFMFLILMSGLLAVPENPVHAAKVLGASTWQIFKDIKLPMIKNIILIAVVIRAMEVMKLFDEIYIMTGGGPGFATETISLYTYTMGLVNARFGFASAAAIIILLMTLIIISKIVRPVLRVE